MGQARKWKERAIDQKEPVGSRRKVIVLVSMLVRPDGGQLDGPV